MPLSLGAIHKPLSDFFLNHFRTDQDSVVQFKFNKFGSVVSDGDFIDARQPEPGYSPALAREKFSDLVNYIPSEEADGVNLVFSQSGIDTTYFFAMVAPSTPVVPDGADDSTRDAIISAFGLVKLEAQRLWEHSTLESSTGLMLSFKPALATPEKWYDKGSTELWTEQSFSVSDASPATPASTGPDTQLWRLRLDETKFQTLLQAADLAAPAPPLAPPVAVLRDHRMMFRARMASATGVRRAPAARLTPAARTHVEAVAADMSPSPIVAHDGVQRHFHTLDVNKRILLGQLLVNTQPTKPAATNNFSVSFKYCVVRIRRPWLSDAFVNDRSWGIPSLAKGALTADVRSGGMLPLLPIAAVVIKDLNIEANWLETDVAAAKIATDFGPFKVGSAIVNNQLKREGLQIIGWLVQRMNDLPPKGS